jgi:hypothetical protein
VTPLLAIAIVVAVAVVVAVYWRSGGRDERSAPSARPTREWPGRTAPTAPSPRRRVRATAAAGGERVLHGNRFTPSDAVCPACSRRFDHCTRPAACLGRGPIR